MGMRGERRQRLWVCVTTPTPSTGSGGGLVHPSVDSCQQYFTFAQVGSSILIPNIVIFMGVTDTRSLSLHLPHTHHTPFLVNFALTKPRHIKVKVIIATWTL